jgi:membrane-associated phospholipid phosphatase
MQDVSDAKPERRRGRPGSLWWEAVASFDLLLDLTLCLLIGASTYILPQHHRPTPLEAVHNSTLSGEYVRTRLLDMVDTGDTVSNEALILVSTLIPLAVALVLSFASPVLGSVKAWLHSYLWTMAVTVLVVTSTKVYCGYWRPRFYDQCGFDDATRACTESDYSDAVRSFPSGHASTSVAALLHTSLRLLGASRVGHAEYRLPLGLGASADATGLVAFCCLLPVLLAWWIAASRVRDNAHHPADVVGGTLIGGASAAFWYSVYFANIFGSDADGPRRTTACGVGAGGPLIE